MADNDIVRRGYLNVVQPKGGMVSVCIAIGLTVKVPKKSRSIIMAIWEFFRCVVSIL